MTTLNEALEAEHAEERERSGYIDIGQVLTPFERDRLAADVTIPIYMPRELEQRLESAEVNYFQRLLSSRRDLPFTAKLRDDY